MKSILKRHSQDKVDWESTAFDVMAQVRDPEQARIVCGFKLQAFFDELQPAITFCQKRIHELRVGANALMSQLYDRHSPVSDLRMIARGVLCSVLFVAFVVAFVASGVGHTLTFKQIFGLALWTAASVGLVITSVLTCVGYVFHIKVLVKHPQVEAPLVILAYCLMLWALVDLAKARGAMAGRSTQEESAVAYVDDTPVQSATADVDGSQASKSGSLEQDLSEFSTNASIKLAIAADVVLGLLVGWFVTEYGGEDYASWRSLRRDKRWIKKFEHRLDELNARIEMAKQRAAAGLTRAAHLAGPKHPPYLVPLLLLGVLAGAHVVVAQSDDVRRDEAILLDVSGSVGAKTDTRAVFRELLDAARQILRTEPADSRTWTFAISTDSFGAGPQTLVRGWTPSAAGVFTDKLDLARRQLVNSFEAKVATLKPIAQGTDIFGALWRAKAAIESDPESVRHQKEIFVLSDMVNESAGFNMPALVPTGAENMMQLAKSNESLVPLTGYRVYVFGASTANLTPQSWTTIKNFWSLYFAQSGAELVVYSSETAVVRK